MNDRNPTWYAEITFYDDGLYRQTNGSSYEKWLAEHDAKVRAEAIRTLRDDDRFFARGEEDQSDDYKRGVNDAADELFALMDKQAARIEREADQ